MNKHVPGPYCPFCEEKIKTGCDELKEAWTKIKWRFPEAHLSWVFRDEEFQNLFFQEGKTKAKWPGSPHNEMKDGQPCAEAMDLFRLTPEKVATFPWWFYKEVSDYLKEINAPLDWGYDLWKWDGDHFQTKSYRERKLKNDR